MPSPLPGPAVPPSQPACCLLLCCLQLRRRTTAIPGLPPEATAVPLQAAKGRLLRVLGAVLLAAGASHAYNWWIGLQKPLVAANWGGGSALLGALCLLRAAWRPASGSAAGKAD